MPVVSLPPPYGGQNNKDGAYNLAPEFAVTLVNWIPGPGYLDARGPCVRSSSNDAGRPIQRIWPHSSGNYVFSLDNGDLYVVAGTIGASIYTTSTNGDFHGNQFQNRTILCNGVDTPVLFDGTTASAGTYSGTDPDGSPLVPANLYGSLTWKGRAYYWQNGQRFFWYAAAGAFQGSLSAFDLSKFTRTDGVLVSIAPMTFDGGQGPDDMMAFLFSNGEVLVYQGDDPSNAPDAWSMIGRYQIGRMTGRSCWQVLGSATLVATDNGVVDLARALQVGATDDSAVAGNKFGAQNYRLNGAEVERQLVVDTTNRILWLALLDQSQVAAPGAIQFLHGMDTESRAWFTTDRIAVNGGVNGGPVNAICATSAGTILGDTNGVLVTGPNRTDDLATNDFYSGGANAYTTVQYAVLDSPDRRKQCTGVAVQMQQTSSSNPSPSLTVEVDSEAATTSTAITYAPGPTTRAFNRATAAGTRIIVSTVLTSKSGIRWHGTDLMVKPGRQV